MTQPIRTYQTPDGVSISAGSLDNPASVPPVVQYGGEGKLAFVDSLHDLPERRTPDDVEEAPFLGEIVSNQHPDHDTGAWPPETRP